MSNDNIPTTQTDSPKPEQSSLGRFPQDQNQYVPGHIPPHEYPETQQSGYNPGVVQQQFIQPETNQTSYQQSPYAQPSYPTQQNYSQPQSYPQTQYDPASYAQNPYSQQPQYQQYPQSQYNQAGYQQNTTQGYGQQTYDNNEYLSYDQKASRLASWILGGVIFAAVVAGLIWGFKISHPAPIPAPTAYIHYEVGDGAFSLDQPVGWEASGGGSNGVESNATFKNGKAKIFADSDLGGSLNGDMLAAANAQRQGIADQLGQHIVVTPPSVTLHREGAAAMSELYANYHEQPMQQFTAPLGSGWYSEFTGNAGSMTGNVHGYRITLLSNDRRIQMVTVCRESDWATLQPAFMHEMQSLDHGKQAGG
jgi:hypothetical protein